MGRQPWNAVARERWRDLPVLIGLSLIGSVVSFYRLKLKSRLICIFRDHAVDSLLVSLY